MIQGQSGSRESSLEGSRGAGRSSMAEGMMSADRFWICLFTGYYLLHVVLRIATGGALGLDEAEILLDARQLEWGYGPQLPLYAWLQWAVFQITGPGLLGLSLLKNYLLLATAVTLYLIIRTRRSPLMAGLSVLSLLMLYQISWEAQRALTHSVLVNFCSVLSFAVIWSLIRKPTTRGFVMLGIVVAMGSLSKYNYAVALLAMLLATFSDPASRRSLCSPRLLFSIGIVTVMVTPPFLWLLNNPEHAFSSARKLDMSGEGSTVLVAAQGMVELALAALGFVSLLLIVVGVLWLAFRRQGSFVAADDLMRFMSRTLFWALVLMAIIVLLSGSTNVKDRWLQPFLIYAGPVLVLWLLPHTGAKGTRRFAQVSAVLAGIIALAMLHHNLAGDAKRAAPFEDLTARIMTQTSPDSVIAADNWIAGNMAYFAPGHSIYSDRDPHAPDANLRVWIAGQKIPKEIDPSRIITLTAPYRFDENEEMSLSFGPVSD
ncbi:Dolichyl-phosphate-mannose-protein mannosyltransferase [Ruegeria halocynthiae]|uniref:Dolichyl-phosphate-mannose-protein mannosyltransferase n=1 Tax=Ruegeria halocynthiae TaxID=985054 RepID=A0A1H2V7A3_9RHOB|nr:glycosyltransferase family 39 protein [Ruegeria halocynthiae]SDW64171.1 Dolichyl-phosphate-mannose-protein mannosyltransferase [Ruegeria halocynthiae]